MARIRSIKPEIRTSEKVTAWPIEVRYFWVLLWGYVNDYGKGSDNARLIKADSYPLDDEITAATVEGYLDLLANDGVIVRYEVGGKRYLAVKNWEEHQKPSHRAKDTFPDPPEALSQPSGESPETLAPEQGAGSREQRAGEQGAEKGPKKTGPHPLPLDFAVSDDMRAWASEVTPAVDPSRQTVDFIYYWTKGDGAGKRKTDWERTWQNDMKRKQQWAERDGWRPKPPPSKDLSDPKNW